MEVNAPSPSAVDAGSDLDIIRAGAEPDSGKSNANLLLFFPPTLFLKLKLS